MHFLTGEQIRAGLNLEGDLRNLGKHKFATSHNGDFAPVAHLAAAAVGGGGDVLLVAQLESARERDESV